MAAQSRSSHPGQVMTPRDDGEIDVVDEAHLRDVLALCGALGLERVSLQQLPAASCSVTRDGRGSPGRGTEGWSLPIRRASQHRPRIAGTDERKKPWR